MKDIEKATQRRLELAMAYTRQSYIQTLRDDYLKGAFGEFMCRQVALAIGKPDHWSNEVRHLLSHIDGLIDPQTKIRGFKDRESAHQEAVNELRRILQTKVTFAKSKVAGYYPKELAKVQRLRFENDEQFRLMLTEFLPSFLKYLD